MQAEPAHGSNNSSYPRPFVTRNMTPIAFAPVASGTSFAQMSGA